MQSYSIKKGLWKAASTAVGIFAAMAVFGSFSDMTIWGLLEQYVKPILGTMTVGGLFTLARNYIKVKAGV
jgi:hypothetical protein